MKLIPSRSLPNCAHAPRRLSSKAFDEGIFGWLPAAAVCLLVCSGAHAADPKPERSPSLISTSAPAKAQGNPAITPWIGQVGVHETVANIMARERKAEARGTRPADLMPLRLRDRRKLPQNPGSPTATSPLSLRAPGFQQNIAPAPQVVGSSFTGATLADSRFPPDTMGAVGPAQFVVAINNLIRTFDKSTGTVDGALNVSMDTFFSSAITPVGGAIIGNFTTDPRIRYDRLSGCWIVTIIDVPYVSTSPFTTAPNRVLIAVSSGSTITKSSSFTFFFFQHDTVPAAGSQWSLFTGRAWVQDLGTLAWTDTNANSQYAIGEPAFPSGSENVNLGPEGTRFFKSTVPTGTPAWGLWLNGDACDIAVRKNFVPFHTSSAYYDRKQSSQFIHSKKLARASRVG